MRQVLIALIGLIPTIVFGQTNRAKEVNWTVSCADHVYVIDFLSEYEERPVISGRMGQRGKMAFLVNKDTGTWTLLTYSDRGACIIASGDHAEHLESGNKD